VDRPFAQVDVFGAEPFLGNPVAVVLDADGLDTDTMQRLARWTNLSESTFVLPPTDPAADYRVRIFTPTGELPFAGHPTLGTCHAWLESGGTPADREAGTVVQECAAGLITLRRVGGRLAFAAPPLVRSGPADETTVAEIVDAFDLLQSAVRAAEWVDNGPGWVALLLDDPATVLAVRPGFVDRMVGLVAAYPPGSDIQLEVRAFFPVGPAMVEDPVTGSLNASLGQWLTTTGLVAAPYVAAQGAALGRAGRVHVSRDDEGRIWVAGNTITCLSGSVTVGPPSPAA
jgi:PhzF family phenazine biosynthesis protein